MLKLILVPEGSTLPEDLNHMMAHESTFLAKLEAAKEREVVVEVSVREMQLLVEFRDLIDVDTRALIGLKGALYNAVWMTYTSTMDRLTVDNLRIEARESNDVLAQAGAEAVVSPPRSARVARAGLRTPAEHPVKNRPLSAAPDEEFYADDGDAGGAK